MSQCPACQRSLTEAEAQAGKCPDCGAALPLLKGTANIPAELQAAAAAAASAPVGEPDDGDRNKDQSPPGVVGKGTMVPQRVPVGKGTLVSPIVAADSAVDEGEPEQEPAEASP